MHCLANEDSRNDSWALPGSEASNWQAMTFMSTWFIRIFIRICDDSCATFLVHVLMRTLDLFRFYLHSEHIAVARTSQRNRMPRIDPIATTSSSRWRRSLGCGTWPTKGWIYHHQKSPPMNDSAIFFCILVCRYYNDIDYSYIYIYCYPFLMPVDHKPYTVFRLDGKGCMAHLSCSPRLPTTGTAQLPSFHEVDQNRKVVDRSMRLRQEKQIVNNCAFPRAGGQFIRCILIVGPLWDSPFPKNIMLGTGWGPGAATVIRLKKYLIQWQVGTMG